MAFDISTGEVSAELRPTGAEDEPARFEDFHAEHGDTLMGLLTLACNDEVLARDACRQALVRLQRRWKQNGGEPNLLAWAFGVGVTEANKTLRNRPPESVNAATGGYIRGLALPEALAGLPLHQRAALVAAYGAGWTDEETALGFGVERVTTGTRRTRAVTFIAHHLRTDTIDATAQLVAHFGPPAIAAVPAPELDVVQRGARRGAWRDRLLIAAVVLGAIALGGALLQAGPSEDPVVAGPEAVFPPNASNDWLGPVGDDRGGFVALNVRGASRFVSSNDGDEWFDEAVWNSRAADLRTEVTGFERSGGRYIATIEAAGAISGFVPPRVATSRDLSTWSIRTIELDEPQAVEGLRRRYRIVRAVWADAKLLVAIELDESLDYRALAIAPADVCVESITASERVAYLCDGTVIEIPVDQSSAGASTRFFLAEGGNDFLEISVPIDPRSLVSTGDGFASVLPDSGAVSVSADGLQWTAVGGEPQAARFLLTQGSRQGQTLQVTPDVDGWTSTVYEGQQEIVTTSLPLAIDPASIWSKPTLASGPAGWALFVTSSRPWDRGEATDGWAVETPKWIVSQLPDSDVVSVQRIDGAATYTFRERANEIEVSDDGAVRVTEPVSGDLLAEVSAEDIESSRSTSLRADGVKSEVLFSVDGSSWRTIWQGREDAWFGSVAVGDDEVLLSGVQLAGRPISIAVDG